MKVRVCAALAAAAAVVFPGVAAAQFPPPPPPSGSPPGAVQDRWPDPPKTPQAKPQPKPQAAKPSAPAAPKREPAEAKSSPEGEPLHPTAHKPAPRAPAYAVTCSGVFAKDSTHLKLAIKYDSRNIVFGQVDGPDGTKIPGSILFPNDPKHRLEVLWANDASRSETSVIAINGKSQWSAPKGLKLGLAIAALEKANGRPFKVSGFGADGAASVLGWEGGALSSLPGGCKVGMRLFADAKASEAARSTVGGDKELLSSDENVRAVKPTVGEILIGY